MRHCLLFILLGAASLAGGCGGFEWLAHLFAPPPPMKTIKAQFDGLKGKTVAIAVYAGPETLLDYQMAQLEVADAVAAELQRNVRRASVVNPLRVIRYQDEHPRWYAYPPERLCQAFAADYLLRITLREYSSRAPGSIHLARGRIAAEANLYAAAPPGAPAGALGQGPARAVWQSEVIRAVYPPDTLVGVPAGDDRDIRLRTAKEFAVQLVRNFHDHKVPREP
jgi:hypothetical protein